MILIQTNKIKFWTIILVSFFIVFSFRILISILNKEYIQNIYYKISESYILDSFNKIRDRKKIWKYRISKNK